MESLIAFPVGAFLQLARLLVGLVCGIAGVPKRMVQVEVARDDDGMVLRGVDVLL